MLCTVHHLRKCIEILFRIVSDCRVHEEMKLIRPFCVCVCLLLSAGVGRTGVFITLSIVLERMRYEGVVDLFQTVKTLRTQRPAMVQTEVRTGGEKAENSSHLRRQERGRRR